MRWLRPTVPRDATDETQALEDVAAQLQAPRIVAPSRA
jgi:hypothetical protein